MLASAECQARGFVPHLRRLAEDHGIEIGMLHQHRRKIGIVANAFGLRAPACDRHEFGTGCTFDRGQMLVAGNLAETDQSKLQHRHSVRTFTISVPRARTSGLRTGMVKALASISKMSPSRAATPAAKDRVAVPKKWT